MKLISLLGILLVFSCTKKNQGPEQLLRSFVKGQFKGGIDRDDLPKYTAGKFLNTIESMDVDEYKLFSNLSSYKYKDLKVNIKKCDEQKCFITYTLSYLKNVESKAKFAVHVKKIAEMEKYEDSWKIIDVNNIKTYIDSKEKIDITGKK